MSRTPPPPVNDPNPPAPRRAAPPDTPVAPTAPTTPPREPETGGTVAHPAGQGDLLASLLAPAGRPDGQNAPVTDAAAMLLNLAAMRKQTVDPMSDYVGDGTRKLRFVQDAISHYAALTGQTRQDIERDALLGITPIPTDLLDAHYQLLYGRPRPRP